MAEFDRLERHVSSGRITAKTRCREASENAERIVFRWLLRNVRLLRWWLNGGIGVGLPGQPGAGSGGIQGRPRLAWWISPRNASAICLGQCASGYVSAAPARSRRRRWQRSWLGQNAVKRIRSTGAIIRTQAPLIRSINDDARTWQAMWRAQQQLGMIPYYMFVERDTGPQDYFAVPLARIRNLPRRLRRSVRLGPHGA